MWHIQSRYTSLKRKYKVVPSVSLIVTYVHDSGYTWRDLKPDLNDLGIETIYIKLLPFWKLRRAIRQSKSDIIHANYLKTPAYATFASMRRPYVLHAHGDDIRKGLNIFQKITISSASVVFYSTEDLAGIIKGSILFPQPVDTRRFFPTPKVSNESRALYFVQSVMNVQMRGREDDYVRKLLFLCEQKGIALEPRVRLKQEIPYEEMPSFLSGFDYFFDREFPLSNSKTALECMAMKIPVVSFDIEKTAKCFDEARNRVDERYDQILNLNATRKVAEFARSEYQKILEKRV
jgi:Glycosyltransferase Family 4